MKVNEVNEILKMKLRSVHGPNTLSDSFGKSFDGLPFQTERVNEYRYRSRYSYRLKSIRNLWTCGAPLFQGHGILSSLDSKTCSARERFFLFEYRRNQYTRHAANCIASINQWKR